MTATSRVEAGRARAAAAKRAAVLTAVAGFLVALGLARQAHPGASSTRPTRLSPPSRLVAEVSGGSLAAGSIASSSGAGPQVQTSTS